MSLVFEQYAERLARKSGNPHTLSQFQTVRRRVEKWFAEQGVRPEDATHDLFELYFDSQHDLGATTKNVHLRTIQAAFNYATKLGRLEHNPTLFLEPVKEPTKEPRTIPMAKLREIRDSIYWDRDWVFFHLLAYAGLRRSEARTLVWDDGREVGNVARLEEATLRIIGKRDKLRYVPIHPALGEILQEHRREPGKSVLVSNSRWPAEETIQEMCRRWPHPYTPHDFRRTWADSLDRNGVRESTIDEMGGWAKGGTRQRFYRRVATPEMHRAILRLYADDPL